MPPESPPKPLDAAPAAPTDYRLRPLLHRFVLRRPDVWVGLFALALVVAIFQSTRLTLYGPDRIIINHLADSFGVGIVSAAGFVFIALLLRAAPPRVRHALGFAWGVVVLLTTVGLVAAYAPPSRTSTSWVLQSLVLAVLGWGLLLAVLLAATGLVRWRDLHTAAYGVGRNWGVVFIYLLLGGSLLLAVRVFNPAVVDPILLRMDLSLGVHFVESIATWTAAHAWASFASHYAYPLLSFFVAGVAACLHLTGAISELRRSLLAVLLVGLLGIVCYWCAPAIGPVYAFPRLFSGPALLPGGASQLEAIREVAVDGPDRPVLRPEIERNVMPSLHTAFTLVALAAAWSHRRRLFWWWLPVGFMQVATTQTLGVHYAVDLIAAVPLAALCWSLADAAIRRFPPTGEIPLPALAVPAGDRRGKLVLTFAASLLAALLALVLWGHFAPISPWLAWPLAAIIAGAPAWSVLRLHAQKIPGWKTLPTGRANPPDEPLVSSARPEDSPYPLRLLAVAVFCSGGIALILAQVAAKYLSTLLGASRPATMIVLAVCFTGLALGAWLCPKKTAGAPRRLAFFTLFIAAWAALLALAFFSCDHVLGEWLASAGSSAIALGLARVAIAILWLLPPTFAMGAQLPTLAAVLAGQPGADGKPLPRFYALSLAGACVFALIAPPLLFNLIGANGALWFVAGLGLFVGIALWSGLPPAAATGRAAPHLSLRRALAPAAAGLALLAALLAWDRFAFTRDFDDDREPPAQISFGLLAALHAPSQSRGLVIGRGSGQAASVVARLGFAQVDLADLSSAHLAATREEFSPLNAGVLDRANVAVHLEDGRNFLLRSGDHYDVIQIEPTAAGLAGATNLCSREFYRLARERLVPDGALVQWIPLHHVTPREIATLLATARAEFAHVAVWRAGSQVCLVATARPPQLNVAVWQQWLAAPGLAAERTLTGITTPARLGSDELVTAAHLDAALAGYGASVGFNTDRNRWLEFQAPQYSLSRRDHRAENLRWLAGMGK